MLVRFAATVNGQSCTVNSGQITANLKDGYNTWLLHLRMPLATTMHNIRQKDGYTIENLTYPPTGPARR